MVVTCSIGVVFADEEREEVTLKVLTKSADKAMYQAKNSGKNRYSIVRYGETVSYTHLTLPTTERV